MHFSRREILKGMGAAGLSPLLLNGCATSESGSPPLPELPDYEWSGPLGPVDLFEHGVAPGISAASGIPQSIAEAFASEPHVRDYEIERRGYLILDRQVGKAQSDWFLLDGVGEGEGNQSHWASWAVMDGGSSLVEMSGPEADNEGAPDLAPAKSGHRPQQR